MTESEIKRDILAIDHPVMMQAAKNLNARKKQGGNIGILSGDDGATTRRARCLGFVEFEI
ncbi:MAG: hypothetical protein K2P94_14430 [Rhodospirillaceae bacterium]|nr:hypothetical protein [Rhodospirillaceae bacterium]